MKFNDQMGGFVEFNAPPQRIISIVPSQTEFLYDLGLQHEIIGKTKFCIHPTFKMKGVSMVGGTKKLKLNLIDSLKPDLIIGNKEENTQQDIAYLKQKYQVWMSDIYTLHDALEMMKIVSEITDKKEAGCNIINEIKQNCETFSLLNKKNRRVAYLIWEKPYMVAANHTFINHILEEYLKFTNVFRDLYRYPVISEKDLEEQKPDLILLSSEPFPFKQKHINQIQKNLPKAQVILVDGEMFSWYGSRLKHSFKYFTEMV